MLVQMAYNSNEKFPWGNKNGFGFIFVNLFPLTKNKTLNLVLKILN